MTLDKLTREAIERVVYKAAMERNEVYTEEWVTAKQLCEQVGFFTSEWLKDYGKALERIGCKREMVVVDADGETHSTRPCYPKKKLLRLIAEGEVFIMPKNIIS